MGTLTTLTACWSCEGETGKDMLSRLLRSESGPHVRGHSQQ